MALELAENPLKSRSFLGLVIAQFLAAFNDQAIHFVAIFYAYDMLVRYTHVPKLDMPTIVTAVTASFIAPFFLFSLLAGQLADKYSKRATIVFWKYVEVIITLMTLVGFLLPHAASWSAISPHTLAAIGAGLVVSAVFMMGLHSTFFVPAKYGIMPELLNPSALSKGNGILEGTSFTASILGTVFGGYCYFQWKSHIENHVLLPGSEWLIGAILVTLAIVGAAASRMVGPVAAAAPQMKIEWQPWITLRKSFRLLGESRPMTLATIGIAFFIFMTLFMRQTLIVQGEYVDEFRRHKTVDKVKHHKPVVRDSDEGDIAGSGAIAPEANKPERAELRVVMLLSFLGLGVGIGCALCGQLSGDRIELGLVLIGGVVLTLFNLILAWVVADPWIESEWPTRICLIFVGISAGLYIVPLFTLLQHRAPKESKGTLMAMSNFVNVSGGLVSVIVFHLLTGGMKTVLSPTLTETDALDPAALPAYISQLETQLQIPRFLLLAASLTTIIMLSLICWQRSDFVLRALSWFWAPGRRQLHAVGISNVPANGHVILATNCHGTDQWMQVVSAVDRGTKYLKPKPGPGESMDDDPFLESVARRVGVSIPAPSESSGPQWDQAIQAGVAAIQNGSLVGLTLDGPAMYDLGHVYLEQLRARMPSTILPVYCGIVPAGHKVFAHAALRPVVIIGTPLAPTATVDEIRDAIRMLENAPPEEVAMH